jgi:hypothetical protein
MEEVSGEDGEMSEYDEESDLEEERDSEAAARDVGGEGAAGKFNPQEECPRVCLRG